MSALLVFCAVVNQDGEQIIETSELGGQCFTAFNAAMRMLFILLEDTCTTILPQRQFPADFCFTFHLSCSPSTPSSAFSLQQARP